MNIKILNSGDNYIYLVVVDKKAVVIDPASAQPVLAAVRESGFHISHVLVTHHHFDHTGGCHEIKHAAHCEIVGPAKSSIPGLDREVADGDIIHTDDLDFEVMALPGHTNDHVAYYCREKGVLFTGDVLFVAGCGRILEGTAMEMWDSLQRILALPDETLIYCGHEYTLDNLEFALHVEPDNIDIQDKLEVVREWIDRDKPSVPSTLKVEKLTNPFLRATNEKEFAELRSRKNIW